MVANRSPQICVRPSLGWPESQGDSQPPEQVVRVDPEQINRRDFTAEPLRLAGGGPKDQRFTRSGWAKHQPKAASLLD